MERSDGAAGPAGEQPADRSSDVEPDGHALVVLSLGGGRSL
jgi:hypothetical protein